jgi:hypothetical protein
LKLAYLDTSVLIAIAFGEAGGTRLARRLARFDRILSANLLGAELRSAFARERVEPAHELFEWVQWVLPERPLARELERVFTAGYVRGADAWHLACGLYVADDPRELAFLTLDGPQRRVARRLGFSG